MLAVGLVLQGSMDNDHAAAVVCDHRRSTFPALASTSRVGASPTRVIEGATVCAHMQALDSCVVLLELD